jgi:hypothetical protein
MVWIIRGRVGQFSIERCLVTQENELNMWVRIPSVVSPQLRRISINFGAYFSNPVSIDKHKTCKILNEFSLFSA